jgi:signal transduction histidine kinase
VTVTASRDGDRWRFEITDNGEGVEESQREVIFEPFRSAKGERRAGTGLGLAICRKLVHRYGGDVGVISPASSGSRFWFALPAVDNRP